ncbi:MAG: phosphoribosylglycinamide formyltransferase [Gammaproteobacteria bacterium]|nr:phosphoribosylglycinamide formyltransferase [Gammaproteobacteria bacterium]|tara:strand:- start:6199 stop:6846 length:648 start_codon:yes stop_codon:yes gene_type:complete
MKKIAVLISGSGSNLEAIINSCAENNINGEIMCVISNIPDAYGLKRAKKYNLRTKVINHMDFLNREEFDLTIEEYLDKLNIDLIVLAGFMRILGKKITKKYFGKMINLHPSLLPLYPGLDTHKKVILNKDKLHGISIHYVSPLLDSGPLIAQGVIKVRKEDIEKLINRIHKIEHLLLPEVIAHICNENIRLENNNVSFKNIKNLTNNMIINNYDL